MTKILIPILLALTILFQDSSSPSGDKSKTFTLKSASPSEKELKTFTLTAEEKKHWDELVQSEMTSQQLFNQMQATLLNTPAEQGSCGSIQLHANFQQVGGQLNVIRARKETFLWKLRAEKNCIDCTIEGNSFHSSKTAE